MRGKGRPFAKGVSGNPSGRPKAAFDLQALAREKSPEAIETLSTIMRNDKATDNARVRAAEVLLDRGYGRPLQPTALATMEITKRADEMTDDELATIAAQGRITLPDAEPEEANESPANGSHHASAPATGARTLRTNRAALRSSTSGEGKWRARPNRTPGEQTPHDRLNG